MVDGGMGGVAEGKKVVWFGWDGQDNSAQPKLTLKTADSHKDLNPSQHQNERFLVPNVVCSNSKTYCAVTLSFAKRALPKAGRW